jgi:hypothetical protein
MCLYTYFRILILGLWNKFEIAIAALNAIWTKIYTYFAKCLQLTLLHMGHERTYFPKFCSRLSIISIQIKIIHSVIFNLKRSLHFACLLAFFSFVICPSSLHLLVILIANIFPSDMEELLHIRELAVHWLCCSIFSTTKLDYVFYHSEMFKFYVVRFVFILWLLIFVCHVLKVLP